MDLADLAVPSVDALLDPSGLADILEVDGPVVIEPLQTPGYSGSTFHRVRVRGAGADGPEPTFIVKETVLADDWFSGRTGDAVGREAAVLLAPELADLHRIFTLPYRAVAVEPGRTALLMDDLSDRLLPDERAPLDPGAEALVLDTLARLHARFWRSPALGAVDALQGPADFLHVMGPRGHGGPAPGGSSRGVDRAVRDGWQVALGLLPEPVRDALARPAERIAAGWADLPETLLHGDTKVANFAVLPGKRLAAFDFAFAGRGPCTFDVGWYVAVNASRLSASKEETLARYRDRLQAHLGRAVPDRLWTTLEEAGVVCGALMLLWSKGAAVAAGRKGADAEWGWWQDRLERWAS